MVFLTALNWYAILASTVATMIIGGVWYAEPVLGRIWMRAAGLSPEMIQRARRKGMAVPTFGMFLGALFTSVAMAELLVATGATSLSSALGLAVLVWGGFIFPSALAAPLFEQRPWPHLFVNAGYYVVNLVVSACILVSWQ